MVKNCTNVLFEDDQLLRLPAGFYPMLQEGVKDVSLTYNDPMWTLLKERTKTPTVLYASAGRIAKAVSYFSSYLCDMHSYKIIDEMIIRFYISTNEF